MKAARLEDGTLHIRDVPIPEPGFEEALIHISAAGICHSDLHIAKSDWYGIGGTGVLGHEAIGIVEALGPGADAYVSVGDRVILGLGGAGGGYWCGACRECLNGRPRLCAQNKPIMGTFAEHFPVYAKSLVDDPRRARRRGGTARVRRPHRVRRGEEAPRPPRGAQPPGRDPRRRRRSRSLRGADRQGVRLPGRRASTWARSGSTS